VSCLHSTLAALAAVALVSVSRAWAVGPVESPSLQATQRLTEAPTSGSGSANEETTLLAIPTRLDRIGRVIVPVTINGQGPFRFIVDTGASHSTVSPQLAALLGLTPSLDTAIRVNGITGTAQVPGVRITRLQAGDLAIQDTTLPVVWAPLMGGADGILGAAGLTTQRLMVDFAHNKVVLSRGDSTGTPRGYTRIAARRLAGGLVAINSRVGKVRTLAIIDTGSERTLGNLALRDALNQQRRPADQVEVTNVFGATTDIASGESRVIPTIAIGAFGIRAVTAVYGDFHIFKVWKLESEPALIIGMDILGTVGSLAIDFKHPYVYLLDKRNLPTSGVTSDSYSMPPGPGR